ncbi:MAG: hypothetical protein U9O97_03160 [Elusimicrobiota bacterium]|nr:hypothetical protein [Elusimicrobiota bacterium]
MNSVYEDRRQDREQRVSFIESNVKLKFRVRDLQYELRKISRGENMAASSRFMVETLKEQIESLSNNLQQTRRELDGTADKLHVLRLRNEMDIRNKEEEMANLKAAMSAEFNKKMQILRMENERALKLSEDGKLRLREDLTAKFNMELNGLRSEKESALKAAEEDKTSLKNELQSEFDKKLDELRLEKERDLKDGEAAKEQLREDLTAKFNMELNGLRSEKESAVRSGVRNKDKEIADLKADFDKRIRLMRREKENAVKIKEEEQEKIRQALKEHYADEGRRVRSEKAKIAEDNESWIEETRADLKAELEKEFSKKTAFYEDEMKKVRAEFESAGAELGKLRMDKVELEQRCEASVQENIMRSGRELSIRKKLSGTKKFSRKQAAELQQLGGKLTDAESLNIKQAAELERLGQELREARAARNLSDKEPNNTDAEENREAAFGDQEKWLARKYNEFLLTLEEVEKGNAPTATELAKKRASDRAAWGNRVAAVLKKFKRRFEEAENKREIAENKQESAEREMRALKNMMKKDRKMPVAQKQEEWLSQQTADFETYLAEMGKKNITENKHAEF